MMAARVDRQRPGWATVGLLLFVGVVLGFLAGRAVHTVQSARWGAEPSAGGATVSGGPASEVAADSPLGQSNEGLRDPFRPPSYARPERSRAIQNQSSPQLTGTPVVRALLYDNVNPTVQIGIGGVTSGWLHTGDLFQGWTVVEISSTSVRITRNGESVVLPSS